MSDAFTPGVVDAIKRHMNVDHADDSVLICRALGGQPEATAAIMRGMDADGIEFVVQTPRGPVDVRIPWSRPLTERAEVRIEVVRMYQESCTALALDARPAD